MLVTTHRFRLFFVLSVALTTTACGSQAKRKKSEIVNIPEATQYFVHGNPLELIGGATTNPVLPGDKIFAGAFNDFQYANGVVLSRKDPLVAAPEEQDLEEENAAPTDKVEYAIDAYSFNNLHYTSASGDGLDVVFSGDEASGLTVTQVNQYKVKPLHSSVAADGKTFSLLVQTDLDEYGEVLIGLWFTKIQEDAAPPEAVDKKFNYLLGEGVPTVWADDVDLALCGPMNAREEELLRNGAMEWTKSGKLGARNFTVTRVPERQVFTDLAHNCLAIADDYLFESDENAAVLGITFPTLDEKSQRITAATAFMSRKGFGKVDLPFNAIDMQATGKHEIGHMLGLHHEFDDGYRSVMSYSDVNYITPHDRAAVTAAYGSAE